MQCVFSEFLGIDLSKCCLAVVAIAFANFCQMRFTRFGAPKLLLRLFTNVLNSMTSVRLVLYNFNTGSSL